MNKVTYKNKDITAYLLGSLPETEAEYLDELSFTDDDFADLLKTTEKDLVDAYVNGELSDENLKQFESYYLTSPLRREKVEFAKSFQVLAGNSQVAKRQTWADFFASWNIFANFNSALRLGFAALLLTIFGIFGWFLFNNQSNPIEQARVSPTPTPINLPTVQPTVQPTQTTPTNQPTPMPTHSPNNVNVEKTPEPKITPKPTVQPTVEPTAKPPVPTLATFVLLLPTRGGGQLQTISVPAKTTDVAFSLPIESNDFKSYQVSLTNQSGKILWQNSKLISKKNALNVRFAAKLLQSNIYSFTVSGISETSEAENIGNYSFRVMLK